MIKKADGFGFCFVSYLSQIFSAIVKVLADLMLTHIERLNYFKILNYLLDPYA